MDDKDLKSQLAGLFSDLPEPGQSAPMEAPPAGAQADVFHALAENAADGIVICNPEGRLTYVNRAGCALFGYNHEQNEMLGLEMAALWSEEGREDLAQVMAQAMAGNWRGDVRQRRKDGSLFDATLAIFPLVARSAYEQPPVVAVMIQDISGRRWAGEALAREHDLLRALLDNIPDYVYVKDVEGRIVAHNAAYLRFGVTTSQGGRIGKTDFDLYPGELAERFRAQEQEITRSGQPVIEVEEQGVDAMGAPKWYLVTKLPLRDAQGDITGLVGIVRDITARKLAEAERERLLQEVQARAEELAILNIMGRALTMMLDVDAVIENLYQYASRLIDTTNFYIALYRPESDQVLFPLAVESGQRAQWQMRQAGQGLTEYVIRTREPLLIEENVTARLEELGITSIGRSALSWLGVPMTMGNRVIGVIAAQSYATPRLYGERQRNLLTAIANQAAIAIENARLFKETQARAEREEMVNLMAARIRAGFTLEQVLQATVQEVGKSLGAPRVAVWLEPASAAAAAPNERSISL